jgi:hypothetical protein
LQGAFNTAYQAGCVIGFSMCALSMGMLVIPLILLSITIIIGFALGAIGICFAIFIILFFNKNTSITKTTT